MRAVVPWMIPLMVAVSTARGDDKIASSRRHLRVARRRENALPGLKPAKIEAGKKYPLVLILHGWGERVGQPEAVEGLRPGVPQAGGP